MFACYYRPAPKNEDEMMVAIFEYIDRLFSIVRPRRLLYMAIDGVVSNKIINIEAFVFCFCCVSSVYRASKLNNEKC